MFNPKDFFALSDDISQTLFAEYDYVWQMLPNIKTHVQRLLNNERIILGNVMDGAVIGDGPIYIGEGARVEPSAYIQGPAYIGPNVVIRHGAYVRENVIMLQGAILGHASEAKNAIFLRDAHAPHFNYVGDSILGEGVNLGAGTKLSNLGMLSSKDAQTGKRPTIKVTVDGVEYDMGTAKMGAIIGDGAQTGCNSVLNPGSLVAPHTLIYANLSLRKGYYTPQTLVKLRQTVETAPRR